MYECSDLRKGLKFSIDGDPYKVVQFEFVKPGKGQGLYKCKIKNMITGAQFERTYRSGEKFQEANIEELDMEYLYSDGENCCFMNTSNYEQEFISKEQVGDALDLLKDNTVCTVLFYDKLAQKNNKKIEIKNQKESDQILEDLKGESFVVDKIQKRTTKRNPYPPFITSKLQQDAIHKLRFSAKKTMIIAQQLYEGIDLGPGEPVGLITYMRTDSLRVSDEAAQEALTYIKEHYGPDYAHPAPRIFKNKNKSQDGHEAIRPTSVLHSPEKVKQYLSKDQYNLYNLIWNRFVASQMSQALINQNTIKVAAGIYTFSVTGSTIKFPGFMKVYSTTDQNNKSEKKIIPELTQGELLKLIKLNPKQHFTTPPPRFSEASLVKELEENGIGRPSTYAAILSTIRDKGYVISENRYFRPSELGFIVNDLLVDNFPEILNIDFTAGLENDLDRVEAGEKKYLAVLQEFYKLFESRLNEAKDNMVSIKGVGVKTALPCPVCKSHLNLKVGKNGTFVSCSTYPDCSFSRNYTRDEKGELHIVEQPEAKEAEGKFCEKCGAQMLIKHGRYGEFLACSKYPECKNTQSLINTENGGSVGVKCPESDCDGDIVEKKSKRGKLFYGCNKYPDCTFASWDKPVDKKCPDCGAIYLVEKTTKRDGTFLKCQNKECGFKESVS